MKDNSLYSSSLTQIKEIAAKFEISSEKLDLFLAPDRIIEASLPLVRDSGKIEKITGYKVQYNNKLGPYKGGLRFHKNVTRDEILALSLWMSLKCAIMGLPYGGGKGGATIDPKTFSKNELERISKEYVKTFYDVLGPEKDIMAPDVNTNPKIIEWMVDQYIEIAKKRKEFSEKTYGAFTGKPVKKRGLKIREEATGFGGVAILLELAKRMGLSIKNTTVAVQGFGNVGYFFAKHAAANGFIITALSDSKGGITKRAAINTSLDVSKVLSCKKEKGQLAECYCVGGVCDMREGKVISNEDLLALPVDVLVPAALENVINESNMKNIKAGIIIEMANGPVTPNAYSYLTKKGVVIIPDILANAGGVTGSWIEWKQNVEEKKYSDKQALSLLEEKMKAAFKNIWDKSLKEKITLREAAILVALEKLVD